MALPLGILLKAFLRSPVGKGLIEQHGAKEAVRIGKKSLDKALKHPRGSDALLELEKRAIAERAALETGKKERVDYRKLWADRKESAKGLDPAKSGALPDTTTKYGPGKNTPTQKQIDEQFDLIKSIDKDEAVIGTAKTKRGPRARGSVKPKDQDFTAGAGITKSGQVDKFAREGRLAQQQETREAMRKAAEERERIMKAIPEGVATKEGTWVGKATERPEFAQRLGVIDDVVPESSGFSYQGIGKQTQKALPPSALRTATTKTDTRPMFAEPASTKTVSRVTHKESDPMFAWAKPQGRASWADDVEYDLKTEKFVKTGTRGGGLRPKQIIPEQKIYGPDGMGPPKTIPGKTIPAQMGPPRPRSRGWNVSREQSKTGMTYDEFMKLPAAQQEIVKRKAAQSTKGYTYTPQTVESLAASSQTGMTRAAFNKLSKDEQARILSALKPKPSRGEFKPLLKGQMGPPEPLWSVSPKESLRGMTRAKFNRLNKKKQDEFIKDALQISENEWKKLVPAEREMIKARVMGKKPIPAREYARLSASEKKNFTPVKDQKMGLKPKDEIRARLERKQAARYDEFKKGGVVKNKTKKRKTSASKRGDGIARKGLTKGRIV